MYDFIIKNARTIRFDSGTEEVRDIYVKGGKIVGKSADEPDAAAEIFDASGKYVLPGLVDAHAHLQYVGNNGVHADVLCPPSGVTTAVDGGSTGWLNYRQFADLNELRYVTTVRAFVHVSPFGLLDYPNAETHDPRYIHEDRLFELFESCPKPPVGLKVRMDQTTLENNGLEPLRKAAAIADAINRAGRRCVLGVHCANLPESVRIEDVVDLLRPGDLLVHAFQNKGQTIFDDGGKVIESARRARARGVYFDDCHGRVHWSFRTLRRAVAEGFLPDIVSSDVFRGSAFVKPGFSLLHAMCAVRACGMETIDILRAVTVTPARALGLDGTAGSLEPGRPADIVVLDVAEKPIRLFDRYGGETIAQEIFLPLLTLKDVNPIPVIPHKSSMRITIILKNMYGTAANKDMPSVDAMNVPLRLHGTIMLMGSVKLFTAREAFSGRYFILLYNGVIKVPFIIMEK